MEMESNTTIHRLSRTSWSIIAVSLLIDISHTRAFPSYNILVGVFGSYLANQALLESPKSNHHADRDHAENETLDIELEKSLLASTAAFSTLTLVSILIDVLYCICWGREIFIDGESKTAKFSMSLFIVNILLKVVALLYVTALQIDSSEKYTTKSHKSSASVNSVDRDNVSLGIGTGTSSGISRMNMKSSSNRDIVPLQEVEMGGHNNNEQEIKTSSDHSIRHNHSNLSPAPTPISQPVYQRNMNVVNNDGIMNMPLPPFTPGIPGLVSPYPRKMKHGLSPPRPPPRPE